jgi:hypothetical protein
MKDESLAEEYPTLNMDRSILLADNFSGLDLQCNTAVENHTNLILID